MNAHLISLLQLRIYEDSALQIRLFELTDPKDFFSAVQALVEELGLSLEETEMLEAIRAGRQAWYYRSRP